MPLERNFGLSGLCDDFYPYRKISYENRRFQRVLSSSSGDLEMQQRQRRWLIANAQPGEMAIFSGSLSEVGLGCATLQQLL